MNLLIVDDSALVRNILKDVIKESEEIVLVGEATNGEEAVKKNRELSPDLIIMDYDMPIMNGLEATKIIMEERPTPIMIFSRNTDVVNNFKVIKYGAVDCMQKPEFQLFNDEEYHKNFIKKLLVLSKIRIAPVFKDPFARDEAYHAPGVKYKMIVIGASTGGPTAVAAILRGLPHDFPLGMVLVQHIETGFDAGYAEWLGIESSLKVRLARDNDYPAGGEVLIAPTDKHCVFKNGRLFLDDGPRLLNQKPSINICFETAAQCFGSELIGVLLTGMGTDGADGCVKIKNGGGHTIVQDESTSMIFGMPKAAAERGGASAVLPLDQIPGALLKLIDFDRRKNNR